ncbi:SusC/RagA family TonB-linked outer membrane protein [Mucilaginibacter sp. dw_454]|uniref:SusC/RagA family TonB-linked outer membrane protein n=1 Tax=Mucilaginibacter sp. dw_454 TaxID=2720079 RepID=UPI001BD52F6C|nr:SusC/RagA family TonB-linked outer membrane protein [Mucilaginibacter sp. dw_454]
MRIIAIITFLGVLCTTTYSFGDPAMNARVSNRTKTKGGIHLRGAARVGRDTTRKDTAKDDTSVAIRPPKNTIAKRLLSGTNSVDPDRMSKLPVTSLQQYLKGNAAGVYVNEPTGEPGTIQTMFIHGASQPLLSAREIYATQPLVVLDGVELIGDHPYAFDIQQYQYDRIGPATNLLQNVNMANVESVQVLKGLDATAIYGPKGANGVIVITSKGASSKRRITFDSYAGVVTPNAVTTINGDFENKFRQQFYNKYAANGSFTGDDSYPLFLSDSLNNAFYGPSNWSDLYYKSKAVYSVNASISGGDDRANFNFELGDTKSGGVGDNTSEDKYNARFLLNMKPLSWFTFSAMVNANRILRDRNKNVRDRLAQMNYIPDLSTPLAPNKDNYADYLAQFRNGFDKNTNNLVNGYAKFAIDLGKFKFVTTYNIDYNEGYRNIFYPSSLLETVNYASDYFGYNDRTTLDNIATYEYAPNKDNKFEFTVGNMFQYDFSRYTYAYAYKGSNDFIKINLLNSDPNQGNYLTSQNYQSELIYKFLDHTRNNQIAFYGKVDYLLDDKYTFSATLRADGASTQQPTDRWFYSPIFSAGWDLRKEFFDSSSSVSDLSLHASAGRMGKYEYFDNYSQGPQYTAFIGFTGNLISPGYDGLATLTRPYTEGYVPYNLKWAYTDQASLGINGTFLNKRLFLSVDGYYKHDKNMLLNVPSAAEYGYTGVIQNGMAVRNTGVDASLSVVVFPHENTFSWTTSINANFNHNVLTALPDGLSQIMVTGADGNERLLQVGKSVDSYWLLTNNGIYNTDAEVPVVGGKTMTYNGITMKAGDPKWKDVNGDNQITDADRTLQGHALPTVSGGWSNTVGYKKWSLSVDFYYNLGRQLLNQEMANRFDFYNREGLNDISSVKEIFFWEKRGDYSKYPIYNPASAVSPYQVNQSLFLENGSFIKLRTLSLGYDLTDIMKKKSPNVSKFYVYGSVNNLFTLTKYSGPDPELVDYTGYDTGYGMQIPKTFTVGVKVDF